MKRQRKKAIGLCLILFLLFPALKQDVAGASFNPKDCNSFDKAEEITMPLDIYALENEFLSGGCTHYFKITTGDYRLRIFGVTETGKNLTLKVYTESRAELATLPVYTIEKIEDTLYTNNQLDSYEVAYFGDDNGGGYMLPANATYYIEVDGGQSFHYVLGMEKFNNIKEPTFADAVTVTPGSAAVSFDADNGIPMYKFTAKSGFMYNITVTNKSYRDYTDENNTVLSGMMELYDKDQKLINAFQSNPNGSTSTKKQNIKASNVVIPAGEICYIKIEWNTGSVKVAEVQIPEPEPEKTTPTVTLSNKTVTYNGSNQSIDAPTISSGATGVSVSYQYYTDSSCNSPTTSLNGAAVNGEAPKNVGTYYVKAEIPASGNYTAATSNVAQLRIEPKTLSIRAENQGIIYGQTINKSINANTVSATELLSGHYISVLTLTPDTDQITTNGPGTITPSGARITDRNTNDDVTSNYNITYVNGSLTIEPKQMVDVKAENYNGTYDGQEHSIRVSVSEPANAQITYSTDNQNFTTTNPGYTEVGTYTVYYRIESANYKTVTGSSSVTIGKRAVVVRPNQQVITYGETIETDTSAVSAPNLVSGHKISAVTLTPSTTDATTTGNIAASAVTIQDGNNQNVTANYQITYENGTLIIREKEIIYTVEGYTGIYDGMSHHIEVKAVNPSDATISYSKDGKTYENTNLLFSAVGTYTVHYRIEKKNYQTVNKTATITITKRNLLIRAENQNILYGEAIANNQYTIANGTLASGDRIKSITLIPSTDILTTEGTITPTAAQLVNAQNVSVTENYNISYEDGSLTIRHNPSMIPTSLTIVKRKLSYYVGDTVNVDDITVTAEYEDGYIEEVTGFTTNAANLNMMTSGIKKLTIYYVVQGQTLSKEISLWVEAAPVHNYPIDYEVSDYSGIYDGGMHSISLNVTTEGVTISYSKDGTTYTSEKPEYTNAGTYTIYYKLEKEDYATVSTMATVTIEKRPITIQANDQTITYGTEISQNEYDIVSGSLATNDEITDITLTASTKEITTNGGITASAVKIARKGDGTNTISNYQITLAKGKLSIHHDGDMQPTSMIVEKEKTNYETGDTINLDDIVVTLFYEDGHSEQVSDYTTNVNIMDMSVAGTKELTITYMKNGNSFSQSLILTVTEKIIQEKDIIYTVEGYNGVYDGASHEIKVNVTTPSVVNITYSEDGTNYQTANPTYIRVGTYTVYYKIERTGYKTVYGSEKVIINKRPITITAEDQAIRVGETISGNKYQMEGNVAANETIQIVLEEQEGRIIVKSVKIQTGTGNDRTGDYEITKQSGTLTILEEERSLVSIDVSKEKTVYTQGDVLDLEDLLVTAYYSDEYFQRITEYTTNAAKLDMSQPGILQLEITYTEDGITVTKNITITVNKKEIIQTHTHRYVSAITKATTTSNGKIVQKCSCGKILSTVTIPKIGNVQLSQKTFVYNKKMQRPTILVKDAAGKVIGVANYRVVYAAGSQKVGTYQVTITFTGNYAGTMKLTYQILPKATKLKKASGKSKAVQVKWKKQKEEITGYEIQYSTSKKFKKSSTKSKWVKASKTGYTLKKLKGKKKYYIRIRTYKVVGKTKYYSTFSSVKQAKTKK